MHIFTCFTVFLFYLSLCSAGSPCPVATNALKVCNCSQSFVMREDDSIGTFAAGYVFTILECKDITVFSNLESDLSRFQWKIIDKLILWNVPSASSRRRTTRFPSDWLKHIRVRMIEILDTQLAPDFILNGSPFHNQTSLTSLAARNCSLKGVLSYAAVGATNTKNLEKASRIELLDLSYNYITYVGSTSFENPPVNLTTINLSHNDIETVESNTFKNVQRLRSINLSHNVLESSSVSRNMFPSPAYFLDTIDLGYNSIKTLPQYFFSNMPALRKVNLENNYLFSLPSSTWSTIWPQLTFVDLTGHIIECDCSLQWLVNAKFVPGRKVRGKCVNHEMSFPVAFEHNLQNLTKEQIEC